MGPSFFLNLDKKFLIYCHWDIMKKIIFFIGLYCITACGSSSNTPSEEDVNNTADEEICLTDSLGVNWRALLSAECEKLSSYNLFYDHSDPRKGANVNGVRYELNSELFTDYARKYRYLFIPDGMQAQYAEKEVFDFPVGTVLAKVFALPIDTSLPEDVIIEVRLMIHRDAGWVGLVYVWKEDVKSAVLDLDSESIDFSLSHNGQTYSGEYTVPSFGSCSTCHQFNEGISPIGPKARLLNKKIDVAGEKINQLVYWSQEGLLQGLPEILDDVDLAPDWRDETKSLTDRAKAYLDINCAHCHRPEGSASLSGLKMEFGRKDIDYDHGVCNSAHGWRGGGFDIWPGDGENSSMPLRMTLSGAPDRMPPLGRSLVDVEAVELIKQWIDAMPYKECAEQNN